MWADPRTAFQAGLGFSPVRCLPVPDWRVWLLGGDPPSHPATANRVLPLSDTLFHPFPPFCTSRMHESRRGRCRGSGFHVSVSASHSHVRRTAPAALAYHSETGGMHNSVRSDRTELCSVLVSSGQIGLKLVKLAKTQPNPRGKYTVLPGFISPFLRLLARSLVKPGLNMALLAGKGQYLTVFGAKSGHSGHFLTLPYRGGLSSGQCN